MIEDNVLAATDTLILIGVLVISALFIGAFTIKPKVEKSLENVTDKTVTMKDKIGANVFFLKFIKGILCI